MTNLKIKRFRNRTLSLLLAAMMLFTSVDITAFATESDISTEVDTETAENTDGSQNSDTTDESSEGETPDVGGGETGNPDEDEQDTNGDSEETLNPDESDESGESSDIQDSDDTDESDESNDEQGSDIEDGSDEEEESEDTESEEEDAEEEAEEDTESVGKASITVDNDNLSIEAINALGSLLLNDIQIAASEEQEEIKQSFNISDVEVTGKTAVVKVSAAENSTVVVGIYEDESERPLAYGYAPVKIGTTRVSVDIEIENMPEYFMVKAYIVDKESLRPLSKEYTFTKYTKVMQEFLKKTTEDFDSDKVVNLDEDETTNFMVVKNDNILIKAEADETESITNELIAYDEDTNTYTFANVDDSITKLDKEDIFVYQYGETDFLIIKVKETAKRKNVEKEEEEETEDKIEKIGESEEVYDITAYEDELDVDDIFQYVKIEETVGTADAEEIDPDSCPEGVTYLGRGSASTYAIDGGTSLNIQPDVWKLDLKEAKAEGNLGPLTGTAKGEVTVSFGVKVELKYYFDFKVWEVGFDISTEMKAEGEIEAEGKFSLPVLAGAAPIEAGDFLKIQYSPTFVIDLSFHGEINSTATATFSVTLGNQGNNGTDGNLDITFFEIDAEVDGYIGFDFEPTIDVKNILHAGLTDTGVHVGAKLSGSVGVSVSTDVEKHDCDDLCLSGEIYFDVPFKGELEVLSFKEYNLDEILGIDGSLVNLKLGDFYCCIKHNNNEHKKFGWGECPYKQYNTPVLVTTKENSKPIKNAQVIVGAMPKAYAYDDIVVQADNNENEPLLTNSNGIVTIWLPAGENTLSAVKDGMATTKTVEVDGSRQTLQLPNAVKEVQLNRHVGALTEDGSLYMWGANAGGAVGNGTTTETQYAPVEISVDDKRVKDFCISTYASAAITEDGSLYMWGVIPREKYVAGETYARSQYTPLKIDGLSNIKQFCMYADDTGRYAAITEDGSLYVWGVNYDGQIGDGTKSQIVTQLTPVKVSVDNKKVKSVTLDWSVSAAITEDGSLYMWGDNSRGQIVNGTTDDQLTPVEVSLDNKKVKTVEMSGGSIAVITEDGCLYMWGNNEFGQLGNGTVSSLSSPQTTPVRILDQVEAIEFAKEPVGVHCMALAEGGSLYAWGGRDYTGKGGCLTPFKVMDNVKSFSAGVYNSAAITEDGSLYCWDGDDFKKSNFTSSPAKLNVNNKKVISVNICNASIATNGMINAAITEDGRLYMWGYSSLGQLGSGIEDNNQRYADPTLVRFSSSYDTAASYSLLTSADTRLATLQEADSVSGDTAEFSGLTPNDIHNIYVMKSKEEEDWLGGDNLLYIGQAVSDDSGSLSVTYEMKEAYDSPEVFCVGFSRTDLSFAEITVSDLDYDGNENSPKVEVRYAGQLLAEGTDYALYGNCVVKDVGEYKIIVRGIGIYCGERELTYKVNGPGGNTPGGDDIPDDDIPERDDVLPDDIPEDGIPVGLWIAGVEEDGYDYTGSAIKPEVRVYDYKTLLIEKTDYTIAYKNNTKANDASVASKAPTITVTGKGNYSGKETMTFKILPIDISPVDISQEDDDIADEFEADDISVVYSGKEQKPVPTLYWNGKKLTNKTDYTFTYHEGTYAGTDTAVLASVKEAGSYYIKLTGTGNFTGTRRLKLTVLPKATDDSSVKPISKATATKIPDQSYLTLGKDGAATPEVTVKYGSETLELGTHYTVAYSNNTKVGTAYVIITGKEEGGYSGTKRVAFKITGMAISKAKVNGLSGQTFIYNGSDLEPELTLTVNLNGTDVDLVKDTDYSVTWQKNRNAGTATVIFTGKNGYTGTLKKTFKIKAFNVAENKDGLFKVELKSDTVPYAKGGAKPELAVTFLKNDGTTQTLKEGTDYTVSYKNNKAVNDGSNTAKLPTLTIKGKGNFTGTYSQKLTYKIKAQDLGNLKLTAADKVYQNKKNIYSTKVTITDLDGKTLKAGTDYDKKLTYTYKNDTTLDNGTIRRAGDAVDKNDIIPTDTVICVTAASKGSNYTGTLSGEYSFKEYDISGAKVTIPKQTYTGRKITLDKTDEKQILVKVKGKKVESDQFDIVGYTNNVQKGTATVTIKGKGNYGGTKTVKFTIKAKGFLWWWK